MMLAQQLVDTATRHAVHLEGLKAGEVREISAFYARVEQSLLSRLRADDFTEFSRTRLEGLLRAVRRDMNTLYDDYGQGFTSRVKDLAAYESEFAAKALDDVGFESIVPAATQVRAAVFSTPLLVEGAAGGKLLEPFIKDWSKLEVDRVTNAVRQGFFEGQTVNQVIQSIRGTKALRYRDGILAISRRNAESVARTAIQHTASVARMETWKANDDIVIGYRWLSTLDSRTSVICRSLDGQVFKFGKGPVPPAHIRCRSTTLAELDGRRFGDLQKGTKRALGKGEVALNTTYYKWLKRQPASVIDDILGPARGQLLRNGGLSAERFAKLQLDKNFRPLTLAEMREREPLAFLKAFGDKAPPIPTPPRTPPVATPPPAPRFVYEDTPTPKNTKEADAYVLKHKIAKESQLHGLPAKGIGPAIKAAHEVTERFGLAPLEGIGPATRFRFRGIKGANAAIYYRRKPGGGLTGHFHAPTKFGSLKEAEKQHALAVQRAPKYVQERDAALASGNFRLAPEAEVLKRAKRVREDVYGWSTSTMADPAQKWVVTTYHEYGHVLHKVDEAYSIQIDNFIRDYSPMRNGWAHLVSQYAQTNPAEYVAESFALYMGDESQHFRIHPQLLKIFKDADAKLDPTRAL